MHNQLTFNMALLGVCSLSACEVGEGIPCSTVATCGDGIVNIAEGEECEGQLGCDTVTCKPRQVEVVALSASSYEIGHAPALTVDDSFDAESRWSANGDGEWIQFDLSGVSYIDEVRLAFLGGDEWVSYLSIEVSLDGSDWTTVLDDVASSGTTLSYEAFTFVPVDAQYVRIVGHGQSTGNQWISITEARIENFAINLEATSICGDGTVDDGEQCDAGGGINGVACVPPSGQTCQYCDGGCHWAFVSSSSKDITSFTINGEVGAIVGNAITLILPSGTSLTSLAPTITHTGASVIPASGVVRNFISSVTYTVTAADGSTKAYTVTVTVDAGSGVIHYVSTSGSDANTGHAPEQAWATLAWAQAHATDPGDIIALKKGDAWASTTAVAIKHGGAPGLPIVWDGGLWGSGANAVISSSGNRSSGNDAIVNIIGCSNVTFRNITVDGNNTKTFGLVIGGHPWFSGNNQNNESNITIDGCSILNCGDGSDYRIALLSQTWNTDMSNITVKNCSLDGSDDEQLSFYPGKSQDGSSAMEISNIHIQNNTMTNWGRRGASTGYGMQINNKCTDVIIEGNTLTQGSTGKGNALQIESNEIFSGYMPTGVVVRYNKMTVTRSNEWCVIVQQGQAKTVDFYYNLLIQGNNATDSNGGAVWVMISDSPSYEGAVLNFWNNTIYTKSGRSFQNDCGQSGVVRLRNNIIYNGGTNGDSSVCLRNNTTGSSTHSHNAYYRSAGAELLKVIDGTYERTNEEVLAWESTAQPTDPLFSSLGSEFTLQSGSACIDTGTDLNLSLDMDGNAVDDFPDLGAYESQ